MKKYIFKSIFILSNVIVAYSTIKLINSTKIFNDTINEISFSKMRSDMCSIIEDYSIRKGQ